MKLAAALVTLALGCAAQPAAGSPPVPLQPLAQLVRQLEAGLAWLGQPLSASEQKEINQAVEVQDEAAAVAGLQKVLDRRVLVVVDINPESRVKIERGDASPELLQGGTRLFLVKVLNHAGVTAALNVESPSSGHVYLPSTGDPKPPLTLTPQESAARWADISLFQQQPMHKRLSGLPVDYQILEIYSKDAGYRSANISFNVGQGTQDIGFRNELEIVFKALPTRPVVLRVTDEHGTPAMASFVIRDRADRLYPNPAKRLAPDLFFQPQIYRADGESVQLPEGYYTVAFTGGPEYRRHTKEFPVTADGPAEVSFQLDRWIDPAAFGWYSGDHHVHAAGCSHYQNPTEGVMPADMMRQVLGERLNVASVLTWGPDYYYQKQFFSGSDNPLSTPTERMHYDLEVSGFPSSHAGHLVLLGLRQQDYPGAKVIEDWPSWDLPILKWAKSQGAIVGFAHSGWGLAVEGTDLPTNEMPGFDGIGANEYIVDVTHPGAVDFISAVDTPYVWELNIWYHTLNVGFRTRIAGETDFPCIYDDRVGMGRTYAQLTAPVTYSKWLEALRDGRSYVSEGRSHLMNFRVEDTRVGVGGSELRLPAPRKVTVSLTAAALLAEAPNEEIRQSHYDQKPYWDVERARIGDTREVPVEIVVNGKPVAMQRLLADGEPRELRFEVMVASSSWIAARILPAAHTNPIFAIVGGKPIRASRGSAEWCLNAVNQCWTQKSPRISLQERGEAQRAYDAARNAYRQLIRECQTE